MSIRDDAIKRVTRCMMILAVLQNQLNCLEDGSAQEYLECM